MLVVIDPAAPATLADQIAHQVRGAVVRGEVRARERLPSARDLAGSLGVNMHTVLRAYAALRAEGVIELRRGRGAVVTDAAPEQLRSGEAEVRGLARELVSRARQIGLDTGAVIAIVEEEAR